MTHIDETLSGLMNKPEIIYIYILYIYIYICCGIISLIVKYFLQYVMQQLFIADTPVIEGVGLHEPFVEELRDMLRFAIRKAVIPLKAYAKSYEQFLDLAVLDTFAYVK